MEDSTDGEGIQRGKKYIFWGGNTTRDAFLNPSFFCKKGAYFLDIWVLLFLGAVYVFHNIVHLACI